MNREDTLEHNGNDSSDVADQFGHAKETQGTLTQSEVPLSRSVPYREPLQPHDPFLSPSEVGRWLAVSAQTVRTWIGQGLLPAARTPSGRFKVRMSDAERLLEGLR